MLKARDIQQVLRRSPEAPTDLRDRAIDIFGRLLDIGPDALPGQGRAITKVLLERGATLEKFMAICEAQAGFSEPRRAPYVQSVHAAHDGAIIAIDNRRLARVAKLAGAPLSRSAGLECRLCIGNVVEAGAPMFNAHAQSPGELGYPLRFAERHRDIFTSGDPAALVD